MVKSGTVVTGEKPTGNIAKPRIPDVCDALGVHCLTLMEYIEAQGWTFSACAAAGDRTPVRQRAKNLPRQARTGWTGRHRPDMQTSLTWTYGTQQNTSPHCPAPWGSSGRRFKSCQPDQGSSRSEAVSEKSWGAFFIPPRGVDSNADSNG